MGHVLLLAAGCGDASETALAPEGCTPPSRVVGDRCLAPGVQDDGCPAGTLGLEDGSCQPAGIPPELCGEGFQPDADMGCEPILPTAPCPPGQMAVPGETACHEVMACGAGKWGDIPVDAATVYVDGSYLGADSDGSSSKPWTTIGDAVAAASSGALVAIAAGSYVEDVVVAGKALRLWGKCPGEVGIVGTGAALGAVWLNQGAGATEIHGLGVTGAAVGIVVFEGTTVLLDRVWVHGTASRGIDIEASLASVTLRDSLVEDDTDTGVYVSGSEVTLEQVVVRRTAPSPSDLQFGRGVTAQYAAAFGARSNVTLRRTLVEDNHDFGMYVRGSDATLEAVVVRGTLPRASDQSFGSGLGVDQNQSNEGRSTLIFRGGLLEGNRYMGVGIVGSDATLEGVVVRGTLPNAADGRFGRGVNVRDDEVTRARGTLTLRRSLVDGNHSFGVLVGASDATVEGVLVRSTAPQEADQRFGVGLGVQTTATSLVPATAFVRGSVLSGNHCTGLAVNGSDATLVGVVLAGTLPLADGSEGDGMFAASVVVDGGPTLLATATVTSSLADANARAGVASFGASVSTGTSALHCNTFDLEGEMLGMLPFGFDDAGGNGCGCPTASGSCVAQSVGLTPPDFGGSP